jgi:hypothetical protein
LFSVTGSTSSKNRCKDLACMLGPPSIHQLMLG